MAKSPCASSTKRGKKDPFWNTPEHSVLATTPALWRNGFTRAYLLGFSRTYPTPTSQPLPSKGQRGWSVRSNLWRSQSRRTGSLQGKAYSYPLRLLPLPTLHHHMTKGWLREQFLLLNTSVRQAPQYTFADKFLKVTVSNCPEVFISLNNAGCSQELWNIFLISGGSYRVDSYIFEMDINLIQTCFMNNH